MSQTTTTVTTDGNGPAIQFDKSYLNTLSGKLKIIQLVLNLIGFICISTSHYYYRNGNWFNFVAWTGLWVTMILLLCHLFHIIEKFNRIPWMSFEKYYCAIWAIFYLIAVIFAVTSRSNSYIAAAVFGFFAMLSYGYDAYLRHTNNPQSNI